MQARCPRAHSSLFDLQLVHHSIFDEAGQTADDPQSFAL
jgi:hypothetical protein